MSDYLLLYSSIGILLSMLFSSAEISLISAVSKAYLLNKYADISWILRFAPVYCSDFRLNIKRRTRIGGRFYRVGKGFIKFSL